MSQTLGRTGLTEGAVPATSRTSRTAEPSANGVADVFFLLLDEDVRKTAAWSDELARRGVARDAIFACSDAASATVALTTRERRPTVAFVPPPVDDDGAVEDALVHSLQSLGAFVFVNLSPDLWDRALDAERYGADDVLLEPCSPQAFAVRAMVAGEAVRRRRPRPWQRPRVVLREALSHPVGGDVLVRSSTSLAKLVVARGRVAWVHDEGDRATLLEELHALGVRIDAEELAAAIAESRKTRASLVDVLERWALVGRKLVEAAMRALVDARLRRALARPDAAALFVPSRWAESSTTGFTAEELGVPRTHLPPIDAGAGRPSLVTHDTARLARFDRMTQSGLSLAGGTAAVVLHYGSASVVSAAGEPTMLPAAWALGATLHDLPEGRVDAMVCVGERALLARRIPGEGSYVICVELDLSTTSLGLGRITLATIAETT